MPASRCLLFAFLLLMGALSQASAEKPVHVLVWDERQPRQSKAYSNFLGNEIASRLQKAHGIEVKSVALDDQKQGLSPSHLEWADVIIWWGHVRQAEIKTETAKMIVARIRNGQLNLIALHSAHWAQPFVEAMNWRSVEDAKAKLNGIAKGKKLTLELVKPPRQFTVPIHGIVRTPAVFGYKKGPRDFHGVVHLPYCCFPDYRPDGARSTLTVKQPKHPIAKGLPVEFHVHQTEMYNEPFHVPAPDEVIFEETWEKGERFRSGMVWKIGKGKVFYFRPGHETYPVYKQPEMIQILTNACRWLGGR